MKDLFELAKQSSHREFYSVSGGQHNDTWEKAGLEYYLVRRFFQCSSSLNPITFLPDRPTETKAIH
jgi:hypothetical protein